MNHMELVPASARLHELPGLLARRPYEGQDFDAEFEMDGGVETRCAPHLGPAGPRAGPDRLSCAA